MSKLNQAPATGLLSLDGRGFLSAPHLPRLNWTSAGAFLPPQQPNDNRRCANGARYAYARRIQSYGRPMPQLGSKGS